MKIYKELEEAINEETTRIDETDQFKRQFTKLVENYMDGMGAESEIAGIINQITLAGDNYED